MRALDIITDLVRQYPDGMLPVHPCKQCGAELGKVPAEVYLGTYTGLCYRCQAGAPYADGQPETSGAQWWNWASHCPAWRRDRECFIGFAECEHCDGKGRVMVSRASSQGGSWSENCKFCANRHYQHSATRDESVIRHWQVLRRSMLPAECAIYELGANGFITRVAASKLILKRRAKLIGITK